MSKMNSRTRKLWYPIVVRRDGEMCKNCKVPATEKQLVIDHKNNNNSDNRLENLQLLCRKCNYLKNPRNVSVDNLCVSVCEEERPLPPEMIENRRMEPRFRQWMIQKVTRGGNIRYEEALNAGAEHTGASTETIKRYLRKMTSSEGMYEIRNDSQGYPYIYFKE
jgi:hypothetical protein